MVRAADGRVEGATKEPLKMNWGKEGFNRIAYPQSSGVAEVKVNENFSEESKSLIADLNVELQSKDKEIFELRAEVSQDKAEIENLREKVKALED